MAAPTYRGSLEDLCQSMTLEYISIQRNLNLVALLGRGCETAPSATRPSWCPELFTLDGDARYRQLLALTAGEERPWRRSKLFNYKFSTLGDSRSVPSHLHGVLTCKALPVGALAMAGRSGANGSESPRPAFGTSEGLPTPYPDKSVFNVFFETLLWGFPDAPVRNYWVYNLAYHTEVLRMWRSAKYRPAFGDTQTQALIDDHRDFRLQRRSLQEWCRWQSWHGSLRTRNQAAKRRHDELFAYVRHFCSAGPGQGRRAGHAPGAHHPGATGLGSLQRPARRSLVHTQGVRCACSPPTERTRRICFGRRRFHLRSHARTGCGWPGQVARGD
jgi:hypothetical protein